MNSDIEQIKKEFIEKFTSKEPDNFNEKGEPYLDYWRTGEVWDFIQELITTREKEAAQITENTSDGYHTFKELYEFRKLYNAAFFNELMHPHRMRMFRQYNPCNVHKSKRHNDGEECFGGGWFIVMATLPTGQISNHYELKDWDLFQIDERERADVWDGHTPQDVAKRITEYLAQQKEEKHE